MIEYNYEIVRDEKDEIRKFKPKDIPTKLSNIVYIEGPNTIGKSTLLHIIALGLFGQKNKTIPLALRRKMNYLINNDKLTFNLKLTSKDKKIELVSEKSSLSNPQIKVYEIQNKKKQLLTSEAFERKYNLIYDIPNNPTERLKELVNDLEELQNRYGNKINTLKQHVITTIHDIRASRDPEQIKNFNKRLKEDDGNKKKIDQELRIDEKSLEIIEDYYNYRAFIEYKALIQRKTSLFHEQESQLDNLKNKSVKGNKRHDKLYQDTTLAIVEMKGQLGNLIELLRVTLPKKESNHIAICEKINFTRILQDFEFPDFFIEELGNLENTLDKLKQKQGKDDMVIQDKMYEELINILQHYHDLEIKIPGIDLTISDFLERIKKEKRKIEPIIQTSKNIENTLSIIRELKEEEKAVTDIAFSQLKMLKGKGNEITQDELSSVTLERQNKDLEKEIDQYKTELSVVSLEYKKRGNPTLADIKKKGDYKSYEQYTLVQLKEEIRKKRDELQTKKRTVSELVGSIGRIKEEIKRIENLEPHKYHKNLRDLEKLHQILDSLDSEINNSFAKHLSNFITKQNISDLDKLTKEQTKYNNAIFVYLGKKLGFIRYLDKEYEVVAVDIINEIVTTKEGKKISFLSMGTGQSQSAYLVGRLNATGNRKIIALLDEVAHMDDDSLEPVYKKLRDLYQKDQLLAAVVVQKAKVTKVVSKIKE